LTPLQQQIAALQSQVSNIPSVNLSPIEQRLAAIESRPIPTYTPTDLSGVYSRLGGLESQLSGLNIPSLDPILAQLAGLESQIANMSYTPAPTSSTGASYSFGPYFKQGGVIPGMAASRINNVQEYAAGGKLLNGPGDGMSDDIRANIDGQQEARLADGEFVVPADVVSHLGNGSTKAGAQKLYTMMDKVRKARTGTARQGREINAYNYLPA